MYFEYKSNNDELGGDVETLSAPVDILDSLPIIELPANKNLEQDFRKDRDMNFTKDYSTYYSENNCRDWMLTD